MKAWLRRIFEGRPGWMNALMVFCAYMAFVYVPWDFLFKPIEHDEEVWLGIMLYGVAAKLTAPLHGVIYAAGAYGFYRMRSWMWPWAAVYTASIAIGMLVWNVFYGAGGFWGFILGLISFAAFAFLAHELWIAKSRFGAPRAPMAERYGEWALVTGASSGIGAAFARALAREGVSCVLSARRLDRLDALATELREQHGVEARVVTEDLTDPAGAGRLVDAISDLPISILISNAGFGQVGRFDKLDLDRLRAMVELHCAVPVHLIRALAPGMRERARGAVVITGSISGRQALPLHAVYSATKGFARMLGESLWVELKACGIDVLVLEPGTVETEFQQQAGEIAHSGESPEQVVEIAIDTLGHQPSVVSNWYDWFRVTAAARILPRPLVAFITRDIIRAWTPKDLR
jgi:short-subunit dehydrogenase